MTPNPQVSICVPTHNGEAFLAACLDSALAQTYSDFELLIVDDASSDATPQVAADYASRDARVRLVRNAANLGLVGNWNRCVELAEGRWVKFLFQDDLLRPHCLAAMLERARSTGREFVACYRDFVFEDGTPDNTRRYFLEHRSLVRTWLEGGDLDPRAVIALALAHAPRNLVGEPTVTLLSRDLMRRVGPFNPALAHLCDAEYWVRAGSIDGIACCEAELATFRVHGASTTAVNASRRAFQKDALDPLLIMHDWLFSPAYAAFRARVADAGSLSGLEASFWDACHDAWQLARDRQSKGDEAAIAAWRRACLTHPRIDRVPIGRRFARKLRRAAGRLRGMV